VTSQVIQALVALLARATLEHARLGRHDAIHPVDVGKTYENGSGGGEDEGTGARIDRSMTVFIANYPAISDAEVASGVRGSWRIG
jgi:hypothetical protein